MQAKSKVQVRYDDSTNMIESLIFTRARSGSNVYRQRFLLRLVELAQSQVRSNMTVVLSKSKLSFDKYENPVVSMPVRAILCDDDDKHYNRAKNAILDFSSWVMVYENDSVFEVTNILSRSSLGKFKGTLEFRVNREVWDCLFDFSKGFSAYNLSVALSLENSLALQIYKGLENQNGAMFYTMESFRKCFGFEDRYVGKDSDLVRFALVPAKRELDEKSPWSFDYVLHYAVRAASGRGRKAISGVEIIPVRLARNVTEDCVRKRTHPAQVIGNEPYDILQDKLYFTFAEIRSNVKLFAMAVKYLGEERFADWLRDLAPKAIRADTSTQGYVVNSLKNFLYNKFGVKFGERFVAVECPGDGERPGVEEQAQPAAPPVPAECAPRAAAAQPSAPAVAAGGKGSIGDVMRQLGFDF